MSFKTMCFHSKKRMGDETAKRRHATVARVNTGQVWRFLQNGFLL